MLLEGGPRERADGVEIGAGRAIAQHARGEVERRLAGHAQQPEVG